MCLFGRLSGCGLQETKSSDALTSNKKDLTLPLFDESAHLCRAEENEISSSNPQIGGIPEEIDNLAKSHFV